ncbi:MAG: hypothetical protein ACJA2W_003698 [Planctomycetota bacterium]|jgi:hypothetical protein
MKTPSHSLRRSWGAALLGPFLAATAALSSAAPPQAEIRQQPPPATRSKKGLQVQLVDDALELGIQHAAINVQLGHLLRPLTDEQPINSERGEREVAPGWALDAARLEGLDRQVAPLAKAGVELNFILLARATNSSAIDALQFDPRYDPAAPNRLGAFRVLDDAGRTYFRAIVGALSQRYGADSKIGRVRGWIVGNEVNSHHWWYNLGGASVDEVVRCYEPAVRIVHEAVVDNDPDGRVYLSLEHHWNARFAAGDATQACPGRDLLDRFAALARERGDFPWHVAFHPYPENLFDCRFWDDKTALPSADSPRVTFKNLSVLTDYLGRDELQFDGLARRVILSEQGFHCPNVGGERVQALAFARAWKIVEGLDGIDAFIYHRHVDHGGEGGLRFGLWDRKPDTVCEPGSARLIREVFRVCDQPDGAARMRALLQE